MAATPRNPVKVKSFLYYNPIMRTNHFRSIAYLFLAITLTACAAPQTGTPQAPVGIANPASVHCEENGGTLEIRTAEDGSQSGYCTFADGSVCEEWAFFRGECKPGEIYP